MKYIYSRRGAELYLPLTHYNQLPNFAFEGEMWYVSYYFPSSSLFINLFIVI